MLWVVLFTSFADHFGFGKGPSQVCSQRAEGYAQGFRVPVDSRSSAAQLQKCPSSIPQLIDSKVKKSQMKLQHAILLGFFLPHFTHWELYSLRRHLPCNNIHILIYIPSFSVVLLESYSLRRGHRKENYWVGGKRNQFLSIPKNSKMGEETVLVFNWLAPVPVVHSSLHSDG